MSKETPPVFEIDALAAELLHRLTTPTAGIVKVVHYYPAKDIVREFLMEVLAKRGRRAGESKLALQSKSGAI